jgi:hypothetical protein
MDEIALAAQVVLQHIKMTREIRVDDYITGFINQVRQYALNAQRGDAVAMAMVTQTLEKLSNDTSQAFTRLNERMDTMEKAAATISPSSGTNTTISATQAAANWTGIRNTKDWQRGLVQAAAVSARSNGTSSPGVQNSSSRKTVRSPSRWQARAEPNFGCEPRGSSLNRQNDSVRPLRSKGTPHPLLGGSSL